MSTVSQFLALASGSSSGSLATFREVYQNTDTPYAYTTSAPVVVNLSTASSVYDMQTVTPGVPAIVHDTSVTNDIVRYITLNTHDVHAGYAVTQSTKETLTSTSTVYVLINLLTGAVKELALPANGGTSASLFAFVIGFDGFVYYVDNNGLSSYIIGSSDNGVTNKTLRLVAYSLSTGLQVGSTLDTTHGTMHGDGGSLYGSSHAWLHFARPTTLGTGHITVVSSGASSRSDIGSIKSAAAFTKINLNGGSSTSSTPYVNTGSGSGPAGSTYTSGNSVGVLQSYTGACQGGFIANFTVYNYTTSSTDDTATVILLDETRETAQFSSSAVGFSGSTFTPDFVNSAAILKDGATLAAVYKSGNNGFRVSWAGDTTLSRTYTITVANPALNNSSAGQIDICQQYGTYKNRFICGTAVYTLNATAKTVTYNKTLYSVPGNNTLLHAPGSRSWTKVYYLTNSVSGQITQLYVDGVDVNSTDPTIISTASGSPVGFQSASFAGFSGSLQFSSMNAINTAVMNGVNLSGNISTQYGTYATVSGERFTRAWSGIASGSTITATAALSLNGRVPYMSGSNYVNATLKSQLVGSVARFDKVRFTIRLPAYTNTSTGASTILIRVLANSNEIKNMKIVNAPSQDVYIHSATQIGVRLGAATNMVAEDVVIEADTFIRFTGGGLLVDSTTYAPLTGTVTLTLSNLVASPRLMGELFQ